MSDVTYFMSGSNNPGEIRGVALSGHHVGVCVSEIAQATIDELSLFDIGPLRVFADSGAFGEVKFDTAAGRLVVTKPITHEEWERRLSLYDRLGAILGSHLYAVAPDMVGHQAETLARLERYAERIQALRAAGVNIIVPLQKGAMDLPAFCEAAAEVLGFDDFICGVPMKKDATSLADLAELADHLAWTGRVTRIHLLGLGPRSRKFAAAVAVVREHSPETAIFCDSVRITALVGRDKATGLATRPYTAAQDKLRAAGVTDPIARKTGGLMMVLGDENRKEAQAMRRGGWFDDELESAPGVPLEPGCIEYGEGGPFGDGAQLAMEVGNAQGVR